MKNQLEGASLTYSPRISNKNSRKFNLPLLAHRNQGESIKTDFIISPYFIGSPLIKTAQANKITLPRTEKSINRSRSSATNPTLLKKPANKVEKVISKPTSAQSLHHKTLSAKTETPSGRSPFISEKLLPNESESIISVVRSPRHRSETPKPLQFSAISNQSQRNLPESIRIQPIRTVFLCSNCYEYLLYPEIDAHTNICRFDGSEATINEKLSRIEQILRIVGERHPNPYTAAISKKLKRYAKGETELEDILILEWFVVSSGVDVGLHWEQLFWVIEQLGKRREALNSKKTEVFWMICE